MQPNPRIFIGFDAHEMRACNVARTSLRLQSPRVHAERICRLSLGPRYHRPTTTLPSGQLFDELSDAPMSTDHAIARFWIPEVCDFTGWALFTDGDVLFRAPLEDLFALADPQYAVMVVQHPPLLVEGEKKSGHIQQAYPRKNWSSVVLFNCGHPANAVLTTELLNTWPGRDLHAFAWLTDDLIGALPPRWNHLVRVSAPATATDVALAHFTLGTPDVPGHDCDPFADEWFLSARAAGYRFHEKAASVGLG